jgi:hypothetical protein
MNLPHCLRSASPRVIAAGVVQRRLEAGRLITIEKHVEIGRLELSSYPVRDAHPPSQFIEMASLGDRDNRG